MERHIEVSATVRVDFASARRHLPAAIEALLRHPETEGTGLSAHVGRAVSLATGVSMAITPRRDPDPDQAISFTVSWVPLAHRRTIPSFAGELRAEPSGDHTRLRLEGDYHPPLGLIGAIGDQIGGRRLALDTLQGLLDRLGVELLRTSVESFVPWRPPPAPDLLRE